MTVPAAPIEILLVSDTRYAAFLATTLVSILKNAAPDDVLRFHIVDAGLTTADLKKLESIRALRPCEMLFYKPNLKSYLKYFRSDIQTFPVVVNYRLFLAKYLPASLDKVLYLDVDVVVLHSLRKLWETPLADAFLAAAKDRDVAAEHVAKFGFPEGYEYFNSGILLFNLKKWREDAILEKLLDVCMEIRELIEFPDQDALNVFAARTSVVKLDTRWNCHPKYYDRETTAILHYMGDRRCIPELDLLFSYVAQTPYRLLPMQTRMYAFKRWLRRKQCQLGCLFIPSREKRHEYRKRYNTR